MPLRAQLETVLREQLAGGQFSQRFPPDARLAEQHDVSLHTVREALRPLVAEGLILRQRGRPTVVVGPGADTDRAPTNSAAGIDPLLGETDIELVGVEMLRHPDVAARLQLESKRKLVMVEQLHRRSGVVFAVERRYLSRSVGKRLLAIDKADAVLLVELADLASELSNGGGREEGWERVGPVLPSSADRTRLGLKKSVPAFEAAQLRSIDGVPWQWRWLVVRADELRFEAVWSGAQDRVHQPLSGPLTA
ncbi:MAG: GntR family transcriptional regulator [Acidimicrobiales bacterium]|jgi:GntR family transcriptional regulator